MNKSRLVYSTGLGVALIALVSGCVGYVGPDGGAVVVPEPEVTVFGGGFERGRDVHVYSHRGYESRHFVGHGFRGRR
jgi:hypothetical protein